MASSAFRGPIVAAALAVSAQASGEPPKAPLQCADNQTKIVSALEGVVGCKDMPAPGEATTHTVTIAPREALSERVENSHLATKAQVPMYREPTLRDRQNQLFDQMNGKNPQSAPPPMTLQQGNVTLSAQAVSGNITGTGGRSDMIIDGGVVSVGASVTITPYMKNIFGSLGFQIVDNLNGTITFSAASVDAARALAHPDYEGKLKAWSTSASLHWGAAFVRFLHEQGKSRDESNPLATKTAVSSTVSTQDFDTFLRNTTTTVNTKTVTLWDAYARQTVTGGYTFDIGERTQAKLSAGVTRDPVHGTQAVGDARVTYYGDSYKVDTGLQKLPQTWGASAGVEVPLSGSASLFARGLYTAPHDIVPKNLGVMVGINMILDPLPGTDKNPGFTRPDAKNPTTRELVAENLRDPRLQVKPSTLGKVRQVVTQNVTTTTNDTQKTPEAVQGASAHVNGDNSVTVTFTPRTGWNYESRIDGGTWSAVTGASFTTAVLSAGAHTIDLREKHPTTGAPGSVTSLPVNIVALNTAPTAINLTPGTLTAGALSVGQSVGSLTCTDLESATCTYTLSSQSTPGAFAVASNGAVTVANAALTAATYTVTVVATDGGGLTRTETKSIIVSPAVNVLPSSLASIGPVGDGGGIFPVIFSISMPAMVDTNNNQIVYIVSGLPSVDGFAQPVSWSISQVGSTINISGLYVQGGGSGSTTTIPLSITSSGATGSTSVSVIIEAN